MTDNYLTFGTPISFGWTAQYLDQKSQTRRVWKDSHATKFCVAFDRAATAGQQLRVPAIDKAYHAGGKQIGWCVITLRPWKEPLSVMGYADLIAEGGMSRSVNEFIEKYFKGDGTTEVWVVNFAFFPLPDCQIEFIPLVDREIYADIEARIISHESVSVSEQISPALDADSSEDDAPKIPIKSCCIPHQPKNPSRLFEPDSQYDDASYSRELAIKRYLRLINSPSYHKEPLIDCFTGSKSPPPKDLPLPSNLITTGRKILPAIKKKILGAIAIHSHCLPTIEQMDVRTLFYNVKSFGYRYNYKSQLWEYG